MAKVFVLAGGGTAGHVNPLIATAIELQRRGHRVLALGTVEGLENDLVPRAGIEMRIVPRVPLPRRPGPGWFRFPGRLRRAVRLSREAIEDVDADAVVGFGGYVSAPAYLAARSLKVPIVVHEANARPGFANRLGARWASAIATSFPNTPFAGAVLTGLPLRQDIVALATASPIQRAVRRAAARQALRWPDDALAVLIMGGSLGAARINEATVGAIERLAGHGIHALHLTGAGKGDDAELAFGDLPAKERRHYVVQEYQHDMASVFAAVDVVVCRAGAGTVAEVTALGLPAIYIPLPIGNGEQTLNAASAVAAGAAHLLENEHLTTASLALGLEDILLDPGTYASMARAARGLGVADGAVRLADLIEESAR